MTLTTTPTISPAFLDIQHSNGVIIGQAVCEESGFWVFYPKTGGGYYEAHTLIQIVAMLDRLNKPYQEELERYFASLPKEISRAEQNDDTPF